MRDMLIIGLGLFIAGAFIPAIAYVGAVVLTLTLGWVLVDLAGKI